MKAYERDVLNELIANTKCQYVIPVFQRNYDWREKDCSRLFDDIIELAMDQTNTQQRHFIGSFVCVDAGYKEGSYNQFILIDGQQRLTSISLLLKALYDYLKNLGEEYEQTRQEIKETYLINKFATDTKLRMRLKPNKVDSDNYQNLMDDKFDEVDKESTIGYNYRFFKKRLSTMNVKVEDFYRAMQRLQGVAVYLDKDDNPQVIFESLNSTGLELADIDLIRNYLLMNCPAEEQERLYRDYWLSMERLLGDNFCLFIRDYLSLKNGVVTSGTKNKAYVAFQKYYLNLQMERAEFLSLLHSQAKVYRKLLVPDVDNSQLNKALLDYKSLDIKTSYPFVFALLLDNEKDEEGNKKINDDELCKILRLLESYLIRRNVCNLAGGGLSMLMASLYNDMKKKYGDSFYKDTYTKISMALAGVSTKAYFPKDDEFKREFISRDMYTNRNVAYILKQMEIKSQGKEIIDLDNLTIEHVMPQSLSKEWISYIGKADWKEFHEKYQNRIGNLTLTAYNSEMSNKLYSEKKSHIDFSRLILNSYFKDINDWRDEDAIDQRSIVLAELALEIWPYPNVTNIDDVAAESHFLLDEDDDYEYIGTTPAGISIDDTSMLENNWTTLFVQALQFLYQKDDELLVSLLSKKELFGTEKEIISDSKEVLRVPSAISNNYFVETNYPTDKKISILRIVFSGFQYEPDDIILFIK